MPMSRKLKASVSTVATDQAPLTNLATLVALELRSPNATLSEPSPALMISEFWMGWVL